MITTEAFPLSSTKLDWFQARDLTFKRLVSVIGMKVTDQSALLVESQAYIASKA